jgi:hypothetical protein
LDKSAFTDVSILSDQTAIDDARILSRLKCIKDSEALQQGGAALCQIQMGASP